MSRRLPAVLTPEEVEQLLQTARSEAEQARTPAKRLATWRDFVMVQTGVLAGPRVAELCSLAVSDIDLAGAVIHIRRGKGDKDRNVPIARRLLPALREWIGNRKTGYLFPGPKGKRLATRTFQVRLAELAAAAGIHRSKAHPHIMRHYFACSLLRSGADLTEIQQLLGHANLATTAIYLHVAVDRLKPALDRL